MTGDRRHTTPVRGSVRPTLQSRSRTPGVSGVCLPVSGPGARCARSRRGLHGGPLYPVRSLSASVPVYALVEAENFVLEPRSKGAGWIVSDAIVGTTSAWQCEQGNSPHGRVRASVGAATVRAKGSLPGDATKVFLPLSSVQGSGTREAGASTTPHPSPRTDRATRRGPEAERGWERPRGRGQREPRSAGPGQTRQPRPLCGDTAGPPAGLSEGGSAWENGSWGSSRGCPRRTCKRTHIREAVPGSPPPAARRPRGRPCGARHFFRDGCGLWKEQIIFIYSGK